jgi:metallophosphoesterase (TIGR00282 family)
LDRSVAMLARELPRIKETYQPHVIIANGENITHGHGISKEHFKLLMELGVHVVTMGNHTWGHKDIHDIMKESDKLIVPMNYLPGVEGNREVTFQFNQTSIRVMNVLGQIFMNDNVTNPFVAIDEALAKTSADITIVDFHGEATSESIAFGHYVDGRVSAVLGTHTHVPTADARITEGDSLSDRCRNGWTIKRCHRHAPTRSIAKFVTGLPQRFTPDNEFPAQLNMTLLEVEGNKVTKITPINEIHPR